LERYPENIAFLNDCLINQLLGKKILKHNVMPQKPNGIWSRCGERRWNGTKTSEEIKLAPFYRILPFGL